MRTEAPKVKDELLEAAKKEFLEKDFLNASLRKIALNCNVSTNSIYTRFRDKEDLFDSIVKECADKLLEIYIKLTDEARKALNNIEVMNIGNEGTNQVISYIYSNLDIFKLIFLKSQGTKYENYFDTLAKIEEDFYKEFARKYSNRVIDDFFIHVICRNGWQGVYELISHDKSYEEAKSFINDFKLFNKEGWMKLFMIKAD